MTAQSHDAIAVVDFGGQYAHLIATKVRRAQVLAEIRQPEDPIERLLGFKGIILSGSPSLASKGEDSDYQKGIFALPVPILGLCFGHQQIAQHYGGQVVHGGREWGASTLHLDRPDHPLFAGIPATQTVWMSHFDSVTALGPHFEELGHTTNAAGDHRLAAIGSDTDKRYGLQFHPEVDDTEYGQVMLENFVRRICGCKPSWTIDRFRAEIAQRIRAEVKGHSVFLLVSGGVDSTVAAKLLGDTLGSDRLHLLHIDNGMMRKDESQHVMTALTDLGVGQHLHFVDAGERFLTALEGVFEPEQKRAIIGQTFFDVFEDEASRLGIAEHLLGQGTIYPDTVETGGTKRADLIKTHHNRVPIIEQLIAAGRVVEPLAELYKVEVRELGASLGIPTALLERHPFPGPGLGVRLLCAGQSAEHVTSAEREELERLNLAVRPIAGRHGLAATVLPVRSVGVKADLRCYEHPVLLSGAKPFAEVLAATKELLEQFSGVNRCILDLATPGTAPATPPSITRRAATMTRARLDLLREADHVVMEGLRRAGLYASIWQCPTVLVPVRVDGQASELCVIRPVHSARAMTAKPAELPAELLAELHSTLTAIPGLGPITLDLTSKPPGTIEWE